MEPISVRVTFVQGGKGDDTIRRMASAFSRCDRNDPRIRMYGNEGDDLLLGSRFDDVLTGGPGADSADGLAGEDICRAEVTVKCELNEGTGLDRLRQ